MRSEGCLHVNYLPTCCVESIPGTNDKPKNHISGHRPSNDKGCKNPSQRGSASTPDPPTHSLPPL